MIPLSLVGDRVLQVEVGAKMGKARLFIRDALVFLVHFLCCS